LWYRTILEGWRVPHPSRCVRRVGRVPNQIVAFQVLWHGTETSPPSKSISGVSSSRWYPPLVGCRNDEPGEWEGCATRLRYIGDVMDWEAFEPVKSLMGSGRTQEALSKLNELVNEVGDPSEGAIVRMTIAHCLRTLGRLEEARKSLAEAYSILDPGSEAYPRVMFVEALVEEDGGNWQQELNKLDEILGEYKDVLLNPEHHDLRAEVLRHRGIALLGLGRYMEGRPLLEAALSEEYDKDLALNFLGQCYFELGDMEQAKRSFREALSIGLRPGYQLSVRYRLGVIHYRLGEFAWALQEFQWCLEHWKQGRIPKSLILDGIAGALKALGRTGEAEQYS
jgi:tetratricopeptide (TPR) repeat protein